MPDGMTVQGYQASDAQVVTEEEVNRRRAANERKRVVAPPRPGAPRLPLTPHGGPEEDPRRALCSNAELLDALDSAQDADAALERQQLSTDGVEVVTGNARGGVTEDDVDDILEQLEHQHDAPPARAQSLRARGTADLASATLTTRPRRRRLGDSRPHRQSLPRHRTRRAITSLLVIVGVCVGATISLTGGHHTAARTPHRSGVGVSLTGTGVTVTAAVAAENAAAERARSASLALSQAGAWTRNAATARTRHSRELARTRHLKRARAARAQRVRAAATTPRAAEATRITTPVVTTAQTTTTAARTQNVPTVQDRPASSTPPAFGSNGTLGPGHSPDS